VPPHTSFRHFSAGREPDTITVPSRRPQGACSMKKLLVLLILVAIGVAVARKVREA
jgi:hypothetical protein